MSHSRAAEPPGGAGAWSQGEEEQARSWASVDASSADDTGVVLSQEAGAWWGPRRGRDGHMKIDANLCWRAGSQAGWKNRGGREEARWRGHEGNQRIKEGSTGDRQSGKNLAS